MVCRDLSEINNENTRCDLGQPYFITRSSISFLHKNQSVNRSHKLKKGKLKKIQFSNFPHCEKWLTENMPQELDDAD